MNIRTTMYAIFAFLRRQAFGIAVLASAAIAFAFPSAFKEWGGVKLISLVAPAIQIIMFGMGTTLSPNDFLRVAKRPWAVATGVVLQFLMMPLVGFVLAKSFGFSGELVAGCVLVGSVAGGTVAALPANVFSIWMDFSGSVLASIWSRRPTTNNRELTQSGKS